METLGENGLYADTSKLPRQNEILFVLDSVGWHEYNKAKTPNMDKIGKGMPAHSHSYYTPPSIESMFRGAVPQPIGKCYWPYGRYSTAGENVIIPLTMKNRGYNTYLLSANILIADDVRTEANVVAHCDLFTFKYFNHFELQSSHKLIEWFLKNMKEPFFAFFLTVETHTPYLGKDKRNATQIRAIEYVDKTIKTLTDGLCSAKLEHKTRMIITSDHSEAWNNNCKDNHGHNPRYYHKFIAMNKIDRLTKVFLVQGVI